MKNRSLTTNILWNTIGNIFYLGCQWLLSVAVVRISGSYTDAGILTLAISTTNIFTILALFSARNYQVSDLENSFDQSEYVAHRVLTCFSALVLCIVFTSINGYGSDIAWSIISYMMMKIVEAFADVLHGILQRQWRMDIVGKSCVIRGIVLIVSFGIFYSATKKLHVALLLMSAQITFAFILYDVSIVRKLAGLDCCFRMDRLWGLSIRCLPILSYTFLNGLIVPIVRLFIERYYGEEMLGYYGSVTTIAIIVQAVFMYIFNPLNGVISKYYSEQNLKAILKISKRVFCLLVVLTGAAMAGAAVLGKWVLALLFGESIVPYAYLLAPTIFASCLTGLTWYLGMLLTIMRAMKALIVGAAMGFAASAVLSLVLIPRYAFHGANIAIITAFIVMGSTYIIFVFVESQKMKRN